MVGKSKVRDSIVFPSCVKDKNVQQDVNASFGTDLIQGVWPLRGQRSEIGRDGSSVALRLRNDGASPSPRLPLQQQPSEAARLMCGVRNRSVHCAWSRRRQDIPLLQPGQRALQIGR